MQNGSRVTGHYFNVPFTGTVVFVRPHTLNDAAVVHIALDHKIEVFGLSRQAIAMEVSVEGTGMGYPGNVTEIPALDNPDDLPF